MKLTSRIIYILTKSFLSFRASLYTAQLQRQNKKMDQEDEQGTIFSFNNGSKKLKTSLMIHRKIHKASLVRSWPYLCHTLV